MKIVAQVSEDRFLVEMEDDEIARCAGFASAWSWRRKSEEDPLSPFKGAGKLKAGTQINFTACFSYLDKLRENESQVRGQAKLLRAMADMLDGAMPTTFIPPDEPLEIPK